MEQDYQRKDYERYFKEYCVGCGDEINTNWETYLTRGNYCLNCVKKCSDNLANHTSGENLKFLLEQFSKK